MKPRKQIFNIALPAMVENLLQMLMGVIDNYLVAQVGIVAVSGVSVANNILAIYQAVLIALGSASASLVARALGAKKSKQADQYSGDALLLTLALTVILGLLSLLAGQKMISLLGTTQAVAQAGGLYLAIVGGGIFTLGLMTVWGSILRAQGKPRVSMQVSLLSNIINAILSAIAIYVCHWGIAGVAGATVLSRAVGALLLWRASGTKFRNIRQASLWNPRLVNLALPTSGERLLMRAGDVIIIALIVGMGTKVVAGNAIGETLTQFNYMPGMAVATATVILVADALGKNDKQLMKEIVKESLIIASLMMVLVSAAIFISGPLLASLYSKDPAVIASAQVVMLYSFLGMLATSSTLVFTAVWQGIGNAKLPFYATALGMWVIRIGLGFVLVNLMDFGLASIWIATITDNIFRAAFLYFNYKKTKLI